MGGGVWRAIEETLALESERLSFNSGSILVSCMASRGYLDSISLGFVIYEMGIIITVPLTSWGRGNGGDSVLKTVKYCIQALLCRQLIYVACFTPGGAR